MDTYDQIATKIATEQAQIIGPIAWREAERVAGISVDTIKKQIIIAENDKEVIDALVLQYERFFGKVSHEVCRDAVRDLVGKMKPEEIPTSLR